jgi:hypothetical protein
VAEVIELSMFCDRIGLLLDILGAFKQAGRSKCRLEKMLDAFENRLHIDRRFSIR